MVNLFNVFPIMKKTLYHIGMFAVAALAFAACQKETSIDNTKEITHVATISLGKAVDTKTMVVEGTTEATYKWNDDDAQYLHVYENGTEGTISAFSLNNNKTIATLIVSFTGTPTAPYSYEAKYAKTVSKDKNPQIPLEQSPLNSTFDPAADVLVSKTISDDINRLTEFTFTMGRPATVNKMTLTGLVAGEVISKVEFSLNKAFVGGYVSYDSENSTYKYNSTSKKLTLNYDATTGVVPTGGEFPVYFICAPVDAAPIVSVVVTTDQNVYTKAGNTASTDPFYNKTITFAIGTMKRFSMNMSGCGAPVTTGVDYTLVSSQSDLISGGTYLLAGGSTYVLGEQKTNNRAGVSVTPNNNVITVDNTIAAYPVIIEAVTGGYTIQDAQSNKYLYTNNTGANRLLSRDDIGDDNYAIWTITITNGVASISNVGNTSRGILCYNPNNGSPMFACYGSVPNGGTSELALYLDPSSAIPALSTPQNLTATDAGNGIVNVAWDAVTGADLYTVTLGETSQTGVTSNSTSFNSVADGTYTVTVTAISNDHTVANDSQAASTTVKVGTPALGKPVIASFTETATGFSAEIEEAIEYATSYDWDLYEGSVDEDNWIGTGNTTTLAFNVAFSDTEITEFTAGETYLLVVTAKADGYASTESDPESFVAVGPSYDFTTVAELNALATTTATSKSGKLTNAVVSYVTADHKNAFIKDNTGTVLYYDKNAGLSLLQGQTFTGDLTVTLTTYNSCAQITSCSASFVGEGAVVEPQIVTLSDLVGNLSTYQNAYVQVNDLTVVSKSSKNINVSNGSNTYVVYDNSGASTCGVGDVISVKGTITHYDKDNIDELKAWAVAEITVTAVAPKAITFSQPTGAAATAGCLIKVKVDGAEITSGTTVASGKTVTIEATEGTDYTFDGWTVTGATVDDDSALTTTFEMGTSAVNVSAAFSSAGGSNKTYYKKVTSITSGKTYIMVDNTYSMIFNSASPTQPSAGIDASSLITTDGIESTSTTDSYAVTITSDSDKYKVLLSTGQYLVINASSSQNGSITQSSTGESITITKVTEGFKFISGNRSTRALIYRSGYNFRNYATSNIGASGYGGYFDLYELDN